MAETTLYGLSASPYVRAARLGLEEKGVAYDLVEFPISEMKQQPHLSRPFQPEITGAQQHYCFEADIR